MAHSIKHFTSLIFLLSNIFWSNTFAQQPGDLDQSFGNDGVLTTDVQNLGLHDRVSQIKLQSDGKIVFVGAVRNSSGTQVDLLIGRATSDGSIDQTFGTQGTTVTDWGGNEGYAGLFLETTGNILCAGNSYQSGVGQFILVRYSDVGYLDSSFGAGGGVFTDIPVLGGGVATCMSVNSNSTLYLTGSANGDLAVAKYFLDGTTDTDFGTMGLVLNDFGLIESSTKSTLQSDEKLIMIGRQSISGQPEDVFVARLKTDGSPDTDFNGNGSVTLSLSNNIDRATDLVMLEDGKLLVVGIVYDDITLEGEIFALRLMSDGTFDTTFGTEGVAYYDIGAGDDYASTVVLQPDGKVIIGGGTNDNSTNENENFCLIRINEDGSLDQTFGNNGVVVTEISSSYERIIDMELQADGKLVVAGMARMGNNDDIALARYHTGLNISVNELENGPSLSVFPNPATETLTITPGSKMKNLELLDALGRTVLRKTMNTNRQQLDLSPFPEGIYLLRATDGEREFTEKILKN